MKWFYWHWENPMKTYNKVRKYFKRPKCTFLYFKLPKGYVSYTEAKILSVNASDMEWKSKYGTPRHEYNPYISIVLFNKFKFRWEFSYNELDTCTWETILDFLYFKPYKGDLVKAVLNNVWNYAINDSRLITCKPNIKDKWIKKLFQKR